MEKRQRSIQAKEKTSKKKKLAAVKYLLMKNRSSRESQKTDRIEKQIKRERQDVVGEKYVRQLRRDTSGGERNHGQMEGIL